MLMCTVRAIDVKHPPDLIIDTTASTIGGHPEDQFRRSKFNSTIRCGCRHQSRLTLGTVAVI